MEESGKGLNVTITMEKPSSLGKGKDEGFELNHPVTT